MCSDMTMFYRIFNLPRFKNWIGVADVNKIGLINKYSDEEKKYMLRIK